MAARVKRIAQFDYGLSDVPHEIRQYRQNSLEYQRTLGQAVVHKHRWNERDLQEGRAIRCPLHDDVFQGDRQWDPICFGTGYVGGFDDGVLTFVTLADAQEDVITYNEMGQLIHERHPGMVAPWEPIMGDGDLIIVVDYWPESRRIEETGDRYELREVTPKTMRGPGFKNITMPGMKPYLIQQEAMVDLLPPNHQFEEVPINFDYSKVPPTGHSPYYDPDEVPPGTYFSMELGARLVADEPFFKQSHSQDVRISTTGNYLSGTQDIRITGRGKGANVHMS